MIDLANKNAQQANLNNTSFIEARITSIPLHKSSIHCIISNCVINLVPAADKPAVYHEISRLLKSEVTFVLEISWRESRCQRISVVWRCM